MKKILGIGFFLSIFLFTSNVTRAQGLFYAQSATVTTATPDSCTMLMIDVLTWMGCINFTVNSTAIVSVSGNTITVRVDCASSMICAGAISQPLITANAGNIAAGTYAVVAEAYLDNVFVNSVQTSVVIAMCAGSSSTAILSQTNNGPICEGQNATLSVTAANVSGYQWQEYNNPNWTNITNGGIYAGATTNQLILNGINASFNNNQYRCIATGISNNDTSNIETLIVNASPAVALFATDSVFCAGNSVTLYGTAGGTSQWYLNGTAISGATTSTYMTSIGGSYNMVQTAANGCSDSAATALVITELAIPSFNLGADTSICFGDSVVLMAPLGGTNQWYLNGSPVSAATSNSYTVLLSGNYNLQHTAANGCNASSTSPILVLVNNLPNVSINQSDTTVCTGDSIVLNATGIGSPQWFLDGAIIAGATASSYTATTTGSYNVEFTDGNGCSNMATAAVMLTLSLCSAVEINKTSETEVFPNPTRNQLFIKRSSAQPANLQLYDLQGKLLKATMSNQALIEWDLSDLPSGLYFIKVIENNEIQTVKVIKE